MEFRKENTRLFLSLDATGISCAFTNLAESNGFFTLASLLAIPVNDLLKIKGFNGAMLDELAWTVSRPWKKVED